MVLVVLKILECITYYRAIHLGAGKAVAIAGSCAGADSVRFLVYQRFVSRVESCELKNGSFRGHT